MLLEHSLHLGHEGRVLQDPWARIELPLPPSIEAAAGHTQLPAKPVTFKKGVTPGLPFRRPALTVAALVH